MANRRVVAAIGAALLAGVGVAAYVVWSGAGPDRADADDAALVAEGARVYAAQCAACHGADLKGQPDWRSPGPDGIFPAPPHDETGHTWHHADALLFRITRDGGQPFMPPRNRSGMPAFGDRLADREIWAVLAYIKSRWPAEVRARHAEIDRRSR